MTVDDMPTTPGSVMTDEDGHRFALAMPLRVPRWVPLTRWERRPLQPAELAARNPTVDYLAPRHDVQDPEWGR